MRRAALVGMLQEMERTGGEDGRPRRRVLAAGLSWSDPVVLQTKMLRQELLEVKADLERDLAKFVLDCTECGQEVHWVQGLSMSDPKPLGHRLPAPHGEPAV